MKTVLSIEQSQRLIELGVSPDLASESEIYDELCHRSYMAVYTLSDLLAILPKKVTDRRNIYNLEIGVWDSGDGWTICYRDRITGTDELDSYQEAEELCDAIYAMICWLKTENIQTL